MNAPALSGPAAISFPARIQNLLILLGILGLACLFYLTYSPAIPSGSPARPPVANGTAASTQTAAVSDVVTKALAFKALLTTSQQSTLQLTYTTALARKWSNLPCGTSCRNGIQLGTNLSSAQYDAAMAIIQSALSSSSNNGSDEYHQMNLAEAYLHANGGGSGYDSTLRWMAFLNTPTDTGAWMLQFGGHHYAANIAFNHGHVVGATPFFMGLEPKTFTFNSVAYDPLGDEREAFRAMLASLSSSDLGTAQITGTSFSDCVMIPGETNGGASSFPAIGAVGVSCGTLSTAQQNLVLAAIQLYTDDIDSSTGYTQMAVYTGEIAQTYISYVGSATQGSASTFLVSQGDYVRISGPHVWIEFSCQGGVVIQGQIHYHTVWRDRTHDYGVDLTGDAIDGSAATGISEVSASKQLNVYPNPSASTVSMALPHQASNAIVSVTDLNGRTVYSDNAFSGDKVSIDVRSFAGGQYFLYVRDNGNFYSGKFVKQ